MPDILIRKCGVEHLEKISQLEKNVFGHGGYSYSVIRQFYDVCGDFFNIAIASDGEIAGYTLGCPKFNTTDAWILSLGVCPQWRQRGIAKNLTARLLAQLVDLGVTNVCLTVKPENKIATHLFNKMGFKPVVYEENYFGLGHSRTIMQKILVI